MASSQAVLFMISGVVGIWLFRGRNRYFGEGLFIGWGRGLDGGWVRTT